MQTGSGGNSLLGGRIPYYPCPIIIHMLIILMFNNSNPSAMTIPTRFCNHPWCAVAIAIAGAIATTKIPRIPYTTRSNSSSNRRRQRSSGNTSCIGTGNKETAAMEEEKDETEIAVSAATTST